DSGPLGPMTDVMWARPDGERVLLAPTDAVADFITSAYRFDRVDVVDVESRGDAGVIDVEAGPLAIRLVGGRGWPLPPAGLRLASFTRYVEGSEPPTRPSITDVRPLLEFP